MSKILEYAFLALGGISFFAVAYLGFAAASGVPPHEIPVLGQLFPAPPDQDDAPAAVAEREPEDRSTSDEGPAETRDHAVKATLGMLSAFTLESPFKTADLQALTEELRAAKQRYEERLGQLDAREAAADDRDETIRLQAEQIEAMRAEIDRRLADLAAREAALEGREKEKKSADAASYGDLAQLFAEGEDEGLSNRLLQFPPEEAAKVLRALDPTRAAEVLNGISDPERWKAYSEAYSKQPK